MLLNNALEQLFHSLAGDRNRADQVARWAGSLVLPDAPVDIHTDATLVAAAEELEAVQMLLLGSQPTARKLGVVSDELYSRPSAAQGGRQ